MRVGLNTKFTKFRTDKDTKFFCGMFFVNFLLINLVTFVFNLFSSALCLLWLSQVDPQTRKKYYMDIQDEQDADG